MVRATAFREAATGFGSFDRMVPSPGKAEKRTHRRDIMDIPRDRLFFRNNFIIFKNEASFENMRALLAASYHTDSR
jgi:hypothetical protein